MIEWSGPKTRPGVDWSKSLKTEWRPEFIYDTQEIRAIKGSDGKRHYFGGQIDIQKVGGGTFPDGSTIILRKIFDDASDAGNPGPLAYLIHHEGFHYGELVGRGWDNYEEGEVRTYDASLQAADIFELSGDFRKNVLEKNRKESARALSAGRRTSLFPTAAEEQRNEFDFERIHNERVKFDIDFEKLRISAEKARKEREAREAEQAKAAEHQRLIDEYKSWVKRHGFDPLMTSDGLYAVGFGKLHGPQYYFTEASTTLDHARMGLFFSFACAAGRIDDTPNNQSVLGEIIGVINNRWSEPGFKSRLELEVSDGAEEECLRHMRDSLRLPVSLKTVNQAANRYWKDWNNAALRRKKESERAQKRQEEEDYRRQRRQDRESRGGSGGDHHTDLTPAQNALDKARREGLP